MKMAGQYQTATSRRKHFAVPFPFSVFRAMNSVASVLDTETI
jgi:hypothetical protein